MNMSERLSATFSARLAGSRSIDVPALICRFEMDANGCLWEEASSWYLLAAAPFQNTPDMSSFNGPLVIGISGKKSACKCIPL